MRIALFHNLPSGGAKRTVNEQVRRLTERHQLDLFSLSTAEQGFADITPYVGKATVAPFQCGSLFSSPLGRLNQAVRAVDLLRLRSAMRGLAEGINSDGYDVALVHPCAYSTSPSLLHQLRLPSLYYRHDMVRRTQDPPIPRPYQRQTDWRRQLDRFDPLLAGYRLLLEREDRDNMAAATRVVTNSHFMRESLYRVYGIAPAVSHHGVDAERFQPLGLERDDFVLSVGMLTPAKGFDFVIRSLGRVDSTRRPRLVIVSNFRLEEEARYLTALAAQHRVVLELRTMVSDDELVRLYNQALCTVYAPVLESFGLVPLESMACGTPVVGIREGGVRETVVDGVSGLLADRDEDEFARAMSALLQDAALREQYGSQGREHVLGHWTWERAIASLERHLEAAVEAAG